MPLAVTWRFVWIGSRTIDCNRHPKPATVWPVRVSAGAFGAGRPVRDLYLSPDHAVFVNEVLVPVKLLIEGTSPPPLDTDFTVPNRGNIWVGGPYNPDGVLLISIGAEAMQ